MLKIDYTLHDAGWATCTLSDDGDFKYEALCSYLHDSLLELTEMALHLAQGSKMQIKASFFDEPGEYKLVVCGADDTLAFQILEYEDWISWKMCTQPPTTLHSGTISRKQLIHNIHTLIQDIQQNIGEDTYKERWVEHEFPTHTLWLLNNQLKNNQQKHKKRKRNG